MTPSPLLRTAARLLLPLLLLVSALLLWRGHHEPGGGFVGGLVATAAFILHLLAFGARATRRLLRVAPESLLAAGLVVALGSALLGPLAGAPFMTGLWGHLGAAHLGTPLLFDLGVFLVVLGFALTFALALEREEPPAEAR